MTDRNTALDHAAALLAGGMQVPEPVVERLRSEVRSGENFLIGGGQAQANFIGTIVIEWGYDVAAGDAQNFRDFLLANELSLHQECPGGVHYRGTYAVWSQSIGQLGQYRTVWAFDSLADFAKIEQAVSGETLFGQLIRQLTAYRSTAAGASRSQQMYQPAAGTTLA